MVPGSPFVGPRNKIIQGKVNLKFSPLAPLNLPSIMLQTLALTTSRAAAPPRVAPIRPGPGFSTHRLSAATAAAAAQPNGAIDSPSTSCSVRVASVSDYWAVADAHCESFYPRATPFWAPLLRLDRVMALQVAKEREQMRGGGQVECIIAELPPDQLEALERGLFKATEGSLGPLLDFILQRMFPPSMLQNYAVRYTTAGVVGAVVIDTSSEFLPQKSQKNGRMVPRKKMAYLSNLAVAPAARRRGVGMRLLRRAEEVAAGWGMRTVALHVDLENEAAVKLYRNAGYRFVARQPEWQRMLEGRPHALALMLRLLTKRERSEALSSNEGIGKKGSAAAAAAASEAGLISSL